MTVQLAGNIGKLCEFKKAIQKAPTSMPKKLHSIKGTTKTEPTLKRASLKYIMYSRRPILQLLPKMQLQESQLSLHKSNVSLLLLAILNNLKMTSATPVILPSKQTHLSKKRRSSHRAFLSKVLNLLPPSMMHFSQITPTTQPKVVRRVPRLILVIWYCSWKAANSKSRQVQWQTLRKMTVHSSHHHFSFLPMLRLVVKRMAVCLVGVKQIRKVKHVAKIVSLESRARLIAVVT